MTYDQEKPEIQLNGWPEGQRQLTEGKGISPGAVFSGGTFCIQTHH